jgi:hypothetical protein
MLQRGGGGARWKLGIWRGKGCRMEASKGQDPICGFNKSINVGTRRITLALYSFANLMLLNTDTIRSSILQVALIRYFCTLTLLELAVFNSVHSYKIIARFKVFTVASLNFPVLWYMTPRRSVKISWSFGGACYFLFQGILLTLMMQSTVFYQTSVMFTNRHCVIYKHISISSKNLVSKGLIGDWEDKGLLELI